MAPLSGSGNSLAKWAVGLVLAAVAGLALMAVTDNRNAVKANTDDIIALKTRLVLVEDHYSTIHDDLKEIHGELKKLNERGRRFWGTSSGHSSAQAPSRDDVLNGNQ